MGKRRVAQRRDDQLAVSKPEGRELFDHDVLLVQEIAADDAEIDRAEPDVARNIVVASIEDRERKVPAVGKETLAVALELQADGMQEIEGVLCQATRALNRHLQWRITGGGATERLLEARCCVGHRDSGTSHVDLASVRVSLPETSSTPTQCRTSKVISSPGVKAAAQSSGFAIRT